MAIHHAIVKSARAKGVELTSGEDSVTATHNATGAQVRLDVEDEAATNDTAKEAWATAQDIADWNEAHPHHMGGQDGDQFTIWLRATEQPVCEGETWDDAKQAFEDREDEPTEEGEAEDEEKGGGSVVPNRYKEEYKAMGHANHCGDWMAQQASVLCRITDGKVERVDCDKVDLLVGANGVSYPNPGTGNRGWEGRYRMTALNMLRKRVADAERMVVPGSLINGETEERVPPLAFVEKHRSAKERKRLAKLAEEATKDAAAMADGGEGAA